MQQRANYMQSIETGACIPHSSLMSHRDIKTLAVLEQKTHIRNHWNDGVEVPASQHVPSAVRRRTSLLSECLVQFSQREEYNTIDSQLGRQEERVSLTPSGSEYLMARSGESWLMQSRAGRAGRQAGQAVRGEQKQVLTF
jgi:hypothetical protein